MSDGLVITAAEMICALGLTREQAWRHLIGGRTGIAPLSALEQQPAVQAWGGQAFDLPPEYAADLPREGRYLRRLIDHLLEGFSAGGSPPYEAHRIGVIMGTTLHGMRGAGRFFRSGDHQHWRRFQSSSVLRQAMAGRGIVGPSITTCAACASGLAAIGLGATLLRAGALDAVICGGYDPISEYAYGGFNALRLIASEEVRPFCIGRQGMKLGEGYAAVVLERARDAQERGAAAMASVIGFAETADAHHLTQPHPQGFGAAAAMSKAWRQAGIAADEVDLLFAHATGTPDNDRGEHAAMELAFGDELHRLPVVALKSRLGHTLGGAGAVELVLALTAMEQSLIPPTAGVTAADLEFKNLKIAEVPTPAPLAVSQSNSIGFGGANASIILRRGGVKDAAAISGTERHQPMRRAVITGIGIVLPGMIGRSSLAGGMRRTSPQETLTGCATIPDSEIEHLISARRVRRLSDYVKLTLAATTLACRDGALDAEDQASCGVILGTSHGSAQFSADYYREIVEKGIDAANPMLFAEGVPNAAAAHLSMAFGCKGGCQTIIGSRTSGLDALGLARWRVATGECERVIISAGEEATPLMKQIYGHLLRVGGRPIDADGGHSLPTPSFPCGSGAISFIIESEQTAAARGATVHGVIEAAGSVFIDSDAMIDWVRLGRSLRQRIGTPKRWACLKGGTWLDRVESLVAGAGAVELDLPLRESFSVTPLAAIAARLLDEDAGSRGFAGRDEAFGVICAGFEGQIAAARIRAMR